jgi:hypothetical protein
MQQTTKTQTISQVSTEEQTKVLEMLGNKCDQPKKFINWDEPAPAVPKQIRVQMVRSSILITTK